MKPITAQLRPSDAVATGAVPCCAPCGRCKCCALARLVMVAVMGPPLVFAKMVAVRIRIGWIIERNSKRDVMRSAI